MGASSHLADERLKQTAIDSINVYLPHIRAGTLRALGVSMPQRSPMLSDALPISEVLQGFDASGARID